MISPFFDDYISFIIKSCRLRDYCNAAASPPALRTSMRYNEPANPLHTEPPDTQLRPHAGRKPAHLPGTGEKTEESSMIGKSHATSCGTIRYWINANSASGNPPLVLLPGLTADHRLFEKQIEHFEGTYPLLVWDAPGHASSWPFDLTFTLADKAQWLHEILLREGFGKPVIIGQSMGGYVAQAFAQLFPGEMSGFISIDSAPLRREYMTALEIWALKKVEPVYRWYPWKSLLKTGANGVATSEYGRNLMRDMMMTYDGDQQRYARLTGHGYKMLAEAVEADLPYAVTCPALLICGEKDRAGSCIRYSREWHKRTGFPLEWIPGAGHNSNTDEPDMINQLIEEFVARLKATQQ